MNIGSVFQDKKLLRELTREFEALKLSGEPVDFDSWIKQRLRAAAAKASRPAPAQAAPPPLASDDAPWHDGDPGSHPGRRTEDDTTAPSITMAVEDAQKRLAVFAELTNLNQLGFSRSHGPRPRVGIELPSAAWAAAGRDTAGLMLGGEGSPPEPAGQTLAGHLLRDPPAAVRWTSKLYAPPNIGVWQGQPEAYVSPRRTTAAAGGTTAGRRQLGGTGAHKARPDWVNAASLQSALRASSAVPHMQAAADRDRRLALSSAMARQQLALGVSPDEMRARGATAAAAAAASHTTTAVRPTGGAAAAAAARKRSAELASVELDHVMQVTQHLTQQNGELARAVQHTNEQLQRQQELLMKALNDRPALPGSTAVPLPPHADGVTLLDAMQPSATFQLLGRKASLPETSAWFVRKAMHEQQTTVASNSATAADEQGDTAGHGGSTVTVRESQLAVQARGTAAPIGRPAMLAEQDSELSQPPSAVPPEVAAQRSSTSQRLAGQSSTTAGAAPPQQLPGIEESGRVLSSSSQDGALSQAHLSSAAALEPGSHHGTELAGKSSVAGGQAGGHVVTAPAPGPSDQQVGQADQQAGLDQDLSRRTSHDDPQTANHFSGDRAGGGSADGDYGRGDNSGVDASGSAASVPPVRLTAKVRDQRARQDRLKAALRRLLGGGGNGSGSDGEAASRRDAGAGQPKYTPAVHVGSGVERALAELMVGRMAAVQATQPYSGAPRRAGHTAEMLRGEFAKQGNQERLQALQQQYEAVSRTMEASKQQRAAQQQQQQAGTGRRVAPRRRRQWDDDVHIIPVTTEDRPAPPPAGARPKHDPLRVLRQQVGQLKQLQRQVGELTQQQQRRGSNESSPTGAAYAQSHPDTGHWGHHGPVPPATYGEAGHVLSVPPGHSPAGGASYAGEDSFAAMYMQLPSRQPLYSGALGATLPQQARQQAGQEALEDRVQRIVEQDGAVVQERARVSRLAEAEERMLRLMSMMESQLHRSLKLQQQQAAAGTGAPPPPPPPRTPGPAGGGPADVSMVEVHQMMTALQHMEDKENAMRRKWLGMGKSSGGADPATAAAAAAAGVAPRVAPGGVPLAVRDGQLSTLFPADRQQPAWLAFGRGAEWERTHGTWRGNAGVQADTKRDAGGSTDAQDGSVPPGPPDAVPADVVSRQLKARRRYLSHQAVRDGALMTSADPSLTPVDIIEDVADAIIEELLYQHAKELTALCDTIGEQLFDSEFAEPGTEC